MVDHPRYARSHMKDSEDGTDTVEHVMPIPLPRRTFREVMMPDSDYPFTRVLRIRVFQIVCGFMSLIMGAVAFIQEKGEVNMGLAMPAGVLTVMSAATSIHTSRGFSGYRTPRCKPSLMKLRFLGPTIRIAVPLTLFWLASISIHIFLLIAGVRALVNPDSQVKIVGFVVASIAACILTTVAILITIDCRNNPD